MNQTVEEFTVGNVKVEIDYDHDVNNPLTEYEGQGKIHSFSTRHTNSISRDEADELIESNPYCVPLSYYEHSNCIWDVMNGARFSNCPDKRWDGVQYAGIWEPDKSVMEELYCSAYKALLPEGTTVKYVSKYNPDGTCITRPPKEGEKPYFKDGTCIDERYSNVITYELPDGTTKCGYKTFRKAWEMASKALEVSIAPEELEKKLHESAIDYAAGVCETYTSWCNGECYQYSIENEEGDNLGNCGGFIGDLDYVIETAREEAQRLSDDIEKEKYETAMSETMP